MKLFKLLGATIAALAFGAHTTTRSIFETDIVNKSGTSVYYFPTTLPTANRVCTTNGDSEVTSSSVTTTTLGYLDATSSIQTQLNGKFTLPSLTAGSVLFSDGSTITQDNANFFWDSADHFFGVGTSSPLVSGHFVAQNSNIAPINSLIITPHLETILDNPTVTTTEIDGPSDPTSTLTCTINSDIGSGSFFANGSDWQVVLYTSRQLNYSNLTGDFTDATPLTADCGVDSNDGQPLTLSISWGPASTGSYYLANVNITGLTYSFGGDLSTTSTTLDGTQSTVSPSAWSSIAYTDPGVMRNYAAYGTTFTPETYYSTSNYSYTATDSSPPLGYVWGHGLTYGSTTTAQILGSQNGSGLSNGFITTSANFLDYNNIWTGPNTITPSHIGVIGDGSSIEFQGYSYQTSPTTRYSSTYDYSSYGYPNDGLYRYLTLSWAYPAGVSQVKFLRNIAGGGYNDGQIASGTSLDYFADTPAWADGTTVTPNVVVGTALIAQSDAQTTADAAQLVVKSSASGLGTTNAERVELQNSDGSMTGSFGYDPATPEAYVNSNTQFSLRSTGAGGAYDTFREASSIFNLPNSSSFSFLAKGGNSLTNFLYGDGNAGTWFFSYGNTLQGSGSTVSVNQKSTASDGIYINAAGASAGGYALEVAGSGNGMKIKGEGNVIIGSPTATNARLSLEAGSGSIAPIELSGGSLLGSPVSGAVEYDGTHFYGTTATPTRRNFLMTGTSASLNNQRIPVSDSNGNLVDSSLKDTGTILSADIVFEAKAGVSIDSGRTLTMGDTSNIVLPTGTGTKIGTTTTQKLGFFNATPVAQQTGNIVTALSNLGLVTSGTVSTANLASAGSFFLPLSTGSLTSIVANEIIGTGKFPRAVTIENIEASAAGFTCVANPTLTLLDCGTSAGSCTSGTTTIGSVTLTAANTITDGTVSSANVAAAHYWAWQVSSGTCTALNATGTSEGKMQ